MNLSTSAESSLNGSRILIVEDEGIPAKGLERKLARLGYAVCGIATSGEDAIRKAFEMLPDLVLMDISLRGSVDGVEAAQQIRSSLRIPIVFLTAHSDDATLSRAMASEPMGYLVKPIDETALKTAIEIGYYKARVENEKARIDAALAKKSAELAAANKELEQFNYIVAHDLRAPLHTIHNCIEVLIKRNADKLDQSSQDFAKHAMEGTDRMAGMIDGLLEFSTTGRKTSPSSLISSERIFDLVVRNIKSAIEEHGAKITRGKLPSVVADPIELTQLFQNLITNAIKFGKPDQAPTVHASAARQDDKWIFSVQDNGIGIDPKYSDKIFVMFKRLHPQSEYQGSGIGLATCKKIVERLGGYIWVESKPGAGSNFLFALAAVKLEALH